MWNISKNMEFLSILKLMLRLQTIQIGKAFIDELT